jgi:hypothetical protein
MQQDLEDKRNEIIIEDLESKIKDYEASLEKKDFLLQAMEGSLTEAQAENARLNEELLQKSESFKQERKNLQTKYEAKADKNTKLQQTLKELWNMCLNFGSRCVQRLKNVFNSVGASAEKFNPSDENISSTFDHIENEVIVGHGDFCAMLASRGTTAQFLKAGSTHAKIVNRPTFSLSPTDLVDIPSEAQSIRSRFITHIWAKGGRELAGDEAQNLLKSVWNLFLLLTFSCNHFLPYTVCLFAGWWCRRLIIRSTF